MGSLSTPYCIYVLLHHHHHHHSSSIIVARVKNHFTHIHIPSQIWCGRTVEGHKSLNNFQYTASPCKIICKVKHSVKWMDNGTRYKKILALWKKLLLLWIVQSKPLYVLFFRSNSGTYCFQYYKPWWWFKYYVGNNGI